MTKKNILSTASDWVGEFELASSGGRSALVYGCIVTTSALRKTVMCVTYSNKLCILHCMSCHLKAIA